MQSTTFSRARVANPAKAPTTSLPPVHLAQPALGARSAQKQSRRVSVNQAPAEVIPLVDRNTGEIIEVPEVAEGVPADSVVVNGIKIAYRANKTFKEGTSKQPPIVLIHGLAYNSYCYRYTLENLDESGYAAIAFDWPGHGSSDKPPVSSFQYTEEAYYNLFEKFIDAVGISKPFHVMAQGYILSQIALLYAVRNPDDVERIMFHGVPLAVDSKLRPEFQAYKAPLPFMRPKKPLDGELFAMMGTIYVFRKAEVQWYHNPLQTPEGNAAIVATLEKIDFPLLLKKIDEGFKTWRKPALVLNGNKDPFLDIDNGVMWLQNKRTCMKYHYVEAQSGHMPFEEVPDDLAQVHKTFLEGGLDRAASQDDMKNLIPNPQGRVSKHQSELGVKSKNIV